MITVVEIEGAIRRLPVAEQAQLRDRLFVGSAVKPKTGAELASLMPTFFHLTTHEADEFAQDLETIVNSPFRVGMSEVQP
jgi:protein involved in temperature-dependent protein secretion